MDFSATGSGGIFASVELSANVGAGEINVSRKRNSLNSNH